jgi:hypothetical protein
MTTAVAKPRRTSYACITVARELPVTKSYPKPGQRNYYLKAPGVLKWHDDGTPADFCTAQITIEQDKGNKVDCEEYYFYPATYEELRQRYPAASSGWWFECHTAEPTPERPGTYLVVCGADGLPVYCSCLGARGHHQGSDCKHRDTVADLVMNPTHEGIR